MKKFSRRYGSTNTINYRPFFIIMCLYNGGDLGIEEWDQFVEYKTNQFIIKWNMPTLREVLARRWCPSCPRWSSRRPAPACPGSRPRTGCAGWRGSCCWTCWPPAPSRCCTVQRASWKLINNSSLISMRFKMHDKIYKHIMDELFTNHRKNGYSHKTHL